MIDPTPNEQAAMAAGGDAAGEYLEVHRPSPTSRR